MSLSVKALYPNVARRFVGAAGDTRFGGDFVSALNLSLDELTIAGDVYPAIPHVGNIEGTISVLSETHMAILDAGLDVHLMRMGWTRAKGDKETFANCVALWNEKKGDFMVSLSNASQRSVDDAESPVADIIGLGNTTDGG